jgi:hypothetical protein
MSLDDLKFPLKPVQPDPSMVPIRKTTAIDSKPIIADQKWNPTGIHFNKGTRYRITLLDPLDVRDGSIQATSLDGWPFCWQRLVFFPVGLLRRRPFDPWFALIGSVDKKYPFRIAYDGYEIEAPATGELYCYFNDLPWSYPNNEGTARLSVDTI